MGVIELTDVTVALPGGWTLFEGVSFRVPDGEHAGLIGANGIGKTTLLRLMAGEDRPAAGAVRVEGRAGLMQQFIGSSERPTSVRDFLLAYSEPAV
ncbi:MAG TPA: ATP-binding cassette domain-containing protein, partial [Actinomycetota bacterium]